MVGTASDAIQLQQVVTLKIKGMKNNNNIVIIALCLLSLREKFIQTFPENESCTEKLCVEQHYD